MLKNKKKKKWFIGIGSVLVIGTIIGISVGVSQNSSSDKNKDTETKQPKQEQEQPKQEQPKQQPPKQEQPKQEPPKQEQEQPKQEQPKQQPPKQVQPEQEPPKQEQKRPSTTAKSSTSGTAVNNALKQEVDKLTKEIAKTKDPEKREKLVNKKYEAALKQQQLQQNIDYINNLKLGS